MSKVTSKIGTINKNEEEIYTFLSDFRNFKDLIPPDKIKDFEATEETCRFRVDGIGNAGMKIIEKEPHKLIKITADGKVPFSFSFWIQLKQNAENDTKIRLTFQAELNMMMKMMIGNKLQEGIDMLVDQICVFFNNKTS